MTTLIVTCLIIAAVVALGVLIKRLWAQQTGPERKAALAVIEHVLRTTEAEQQRSDALAGELGMIVTACRRELDLIRRCFRQEIPSRVAAVIGKEFFHDALRSRLGRKRKLLFEEQCRDKINYAIQAQQFKPKVNDAITKMAAALEQKIKDFEKRSAIRIWLPDLTDEVTIGLVRLLSDQRRRDRFLGDNPLLHDAAKQLLANAPLPTWSVREAFRHYGFSLRELLATVQFPSDAYARTQVELNQSDKTGLGLRRFLIESVVLAGLADAIYHLTHENAEGVIRMALHLILGASGVFLEVIWDWLKQWILEHFGHEVLQEVITVLGDLATGIIVVTWLWRGYRYAKLIQKVRVFWSGEEILPILRSKFQDVCAEVLDRIAQQPIVEAESRIERCIEELNRRVNEVRTEAAARRAFVAASA